MLKPREFQARPENSNHTYEHPFGRAVLLNIHEIVFGHLEIDHLELSQFRRKIIMQRRNFYKYIIGMIRDYKIH